MKKYIPIIFLLLFVLCFFDCTHKPEIPLPVQQKDSTTTTTTTTTTIDTTSDIADTSVCFQRDIFPIFTGSCAMAGCHDPITKAKGYNLSTYASILGNGVIPYRDNVSKAYTECTNGKMPQSPVPKLDSTQLSLIKRWIDEGAHNDSNCAVNCDTTKYTYSAAIVPILSNYCYSCHSAAPAPSTGGGIVLDNYNSLKIQVSNGKLIGDLEHLTGNNFMPLGGTQLSDCKITQFKKWIAAGALNN